MKLNPSCLDALFPLKNANAKKQWGSQEAERATGWPGPGCGCPWGVTSSHAWLVAGFLTTADWVNWRQRTFLNRCSGIRGQRLHIATPSNHYKVISTSTYILNELPVKIFLEKHQDTDTVLNKQQLCSLGFFCKLNQLLQPGKWPHCCQGRRFKISRDFPPSISRTFKAIDEGVYPILGVKLKL